MEYSNQQIEEYLTDSYQSKLSSEESIDQLINHKLSWGFPILLKTSWIPTVAFLAPHPAPPNPAEEALPRPGAREPGTSWDVENTRKPRLILRTLI